jgi:hypothetical protein
MKPLSVLMKMITDSKFFTAIFEGINFTPKQFMICTFGLLFEENLPSHFSQDYISFFQIICSFLHVLPSSISGG